MEERFHHRERRGRGEELCYQQTDRAEDRWRSETARRTAWCGARSGGIGVGRARGERQAPATAWRAGRSARARFADFQRRGGREDNERTRSARIRARD